MGLSLRAADLHFDCQSAYHRSRVARADNIGHRRVNRADRDSGVSGVAKESAGEFLTRALRFRREQNIAADEIKQDAKRSERNHRE